MDTAGVDDKCHQAVAAVSSVLGELSQQVEHLQREVQYWKAEASAWRNRYEEEGHRCQRLRRVLRCNTSFARNHAPPMLSPRARSIACASGAIGVRSDPFAAAAVQEASSASQAAAVTADGAAAAAAATAAGGSSEPSSSRGAEAVDGTCCGPLGAAAAADAASDSTGARAAQPQHPCTNQQQQRPAAIGVGYQRAAEAAAAAPAAISALHTLSRSNTLGAAPSICEAVLSPRHASPLGAGTLSCSLLQTGAPPEGQEEADSMQADGLQRRASDLRRLATCPPPDSSTRSLSCRSCPVLQAPWSSNTLTGSLLGSYSMNPPGGPSFRKQLTVDHLLKMMMAFTMMSGNSNGNGGGGGAAGAPGGSGGQNPAGGGSGVEPPAVEDDDNLASVSLDDDGSSGVGLAAAAAVSAAMARAWASAASKEQRAVSNGRGEVAPGTSSTGKAGFRLVATVTHKMGKRSRSTTGMHHSTSTDSLDSNLADGSSLYGTSPTASSSNLLALAAANTRSSSSQAQALGGANRPDGHSMLSQQLRSSKSSGSVASLANTGPLQGSTFQRQYAGTAAAAPLDLNNSGGGATRPPLSPGQQGFTATEPAAAAAAAAAAAGPPKKVQVSPATQQQQQQPWLVGRGTSNGGCAAASKSSYVALHWLSRPRSVLVVRKFAPATESFFDMALAWLKVHGVTVYVEPSVYDETAERLGLQAATRGAPLKREDHHQQQQQQQRHPEETSPRSGSGGGGGAGLALATATSSGSTSSTSSAAEGSIVGSGWLRSWRPDEEGGVMIPEVVASLLDLVVTLGGDGTVLWTCYIFGNRSVPPLVPFNLGSLGFLTPFQPGGVKGVLGRCLKGGFPIQLRHRLHCTIVRRQQGAGSPSAAVAAAVADAAGYPIMGACWGVLEGAEHMALNEVVIDRGSSPFLSNLECYCDGNFVTHVQGDGLIVATPTGSTAYSLAAGGSMVHPQVPCILFTPICPHSLSFRPLMFPDHVQLCVQVPADSRSQVWCSFDGKHRTELLPGEGVVIRLSKWPVPTVAADLDTSRDWFSAVRECLHWNLRDVQGRNNAKVHTPH